MPHKPFPEDITYTESPNPQGSPELWPMQFQRMQRLYATVEDWEPHRAIIAQLYHEQNMTLRETMNIMAREHSFFATYASQRSEVCLMMIGSD